MKILVCIKQVPDMESKVKIDTEGTWYAANNLAWRMNEYDEYAVEQAVQLKQQVGGDSDLTVLCIGPGRAKETMKKALAMGADRGLHVVAEFAKDKGFDLIFTGLQSQDRGSAQRELEGGIKAKVSCSTPVLGTCQPGLDTPRYPTLPNIMKSKKKELLSVPVADRLKVEAKHETARIYFPEKRGGAARSGARRGSRRSGRIGDVPG